MSGLLDMLTGIHRYFPNTMTMGLIVLGLALSRVSWVLVGVGSLLLTILVGIGQMGAQNLPFFRTDQTAGLVEACSVLPIGCEYSMLPSYWFTISTYFLAYILSNAVSVYSKNPTKQPSTSIAVQQRMGLGVISMVAVVIVGVILLVARMMSPCESWAGIIFGILIGGVWGWLWWFILNGTGNDIFQDIHGVMIGLQPGDLRMGPVACTPA